MGLEGLKKKKKHNNNNKKWDTRIVGFKSALDSQEVSLALSFVSHLPLLSRMCNEDLCTVRKPTCRPFPFLLALPSSQAGGYQKMSASSSKCGGPGGAGKKKRGPRRRAGGRCNDGGEGDTRLSVSS